MKEKKILEKIQNMSPEELVTHIFQEIESIKTKLNIDEKSILEAKKRILEEQVEYEKYLKNQDENIVDPLTECGIINSAIGFNNPNGAKQIPYNSQEDYPNFTDAIPIRFGFDPTNPQSLLLMLDMMNQLLYTATLAAKWFTTGQKPTWQQSVIDRNGGYNKGATIREIGLYESYDYYISSSNNNINPKPTTNSYEGWAKILNLQLGSPYTEFTFEEATFFISFKHTDYIYEIEINESGTIDLIIIDKTTGKRFVQSSNGNGNILKQNNNLLASYLNTGAKAPMFQDIHMAQPIGYIESNDNYHYTIYLSSGTVIEWGQRGVNANDSLQVFYYNDFVNGKTTLPLIGTVVTTPSIAPNYTIDEIDATGFTFINLTGSIMNFSYIVIGKLANYVGDILGKIRAYMITPYYKKLSDQQKEELDQYYIELDKEKDAIKVIPPKWWEKEIEGKELD